AEFATPEQLVRAARAMRELGQKKLDAYTPYPLRDLEQLIEPGRSPLNWLVLPFALGGAVFAYLLQLYLNGVNYPLNVGGRPLPSAPAFVPITFETTVLSAGLSGLVIMLVLTKLPELWSPVFDVPGFERASIDRFWLGIDASDPRFDRDVVE